MDEKVFAIHGGTAINLFLKDLPRYSVDIDLTYIPLADRQTSLNDINMHLKTIAKRQRKHSKECTSLQTQVLANSCASTEVSR